MLYENPNYFGPESPAARTPAGLDGNEVFLAVMAATLALVLVLLLVKWFRKR
jgi:hypothetical protein